MAAPATPTNVLVQTANIQNLVSWDLTSTATSYLIKRSLDNVTFSALSTISGSPLATSYLDTAVTTGVTYWYQVAAANNSGVDISAYSASAGPAVPTLPGEYTLGQLRLMAQQRADRVNSNFVSTTEWNDYIRQSYFELYDILVTQYEDYFVAPAASFVTDGVNYQYQLPNGLLSAFTNDSGSTFTPQGFYKLMGVDLALNNAVNSFVTLNKFNFSDRNKFLYPNSASTIYGVFNMQYRVLGSLIEFIPTPTAGQKIRLWYVPRLTQLLADTDSTSRTVSGWSEYIIVDAAIKALEKEESDTQVLMLQKQGLLERIRSSAANRDQGSPDTISEVSPFQSMNGMSAFSGFKGGW